MDLRPDNDGQSGVQSASTHMQAANTSRDSKRDMFQRKGSGAAGITLIEVMIVVAILAVLATLAVPNLSELFIRNRLDTTANEFMTALNLARSEAIRRGVPVSIRRASATAQDWAQGWEIFVDINGNGTRETSDSREEVIRVGQPLASSLTLRSSSVVGTFVPFTPTGSVALDLDDATNLLFPRATFMVCYDGAPRVGTRSRSRAVLVNSPGRVRLGPDSNNNGLPEDARGRDISDCGPA